MGHSQVSYDFSDADSTTTEERRAASLQLVSAGIRLNAPTEDTALVLTVMGLDS